MHPDLVSDHYEHQMMLTDHRYLLTGLRDPMEGFGHHPLFLLHYNHYHYYQWEIKEHIMSKMHHMIR